MNCRHCIDRLDDYLEGELSPGDTLALGRHLLTCVECRAGFDSLQSLRAATAALPRELVPPHDGWPAISTAIHRRGATDEHTVARGVASRLGAADAVGERPNSPERLSAGLVVRWFGPLAMAAAVTLLVSLAERDFAAQRHSSGWTVDPLAGAPRVNASRIDAPGRLRVGQWLETDADSRARVAVGEIGEVRVEPNSRVRLVDASRQEHRLELARGTLNALIWAPPRLFFVNTPSATAVDLGCAYTLTVDHDGRGELTVTSGYVALEHGERESIIPYGMMCLTRPGVGPGTPFAVDAPADLRASLEAFDFDPRRRPGALADVLARASAADTVTLWHLLGRTREPERAAVFDVLARHHAPPAEVTRAGIVAGDRPMRAAWARELGLEVAARP